MLLSMTAFARCSIEHDTGRYTWEIRSVNHRYAEVYIRMPEEFRGLEAELRKRISGRLTRGKIDCNLRIERSAKPNDLVVNEEIARGLLNALDKLGEIAGQKSSPNMMSVLQWPGVLESNKEDNEQASADILKSFNESLDNLIATRQREGEKLEQILSERCASLAEQIAYLRTRVPDIIGATTERWSTRLKEMDQSIDNARVEQECALLLQKLDVAEELDRLSAHLDEVQRVIKKGSPAGRRLDFLMQELNREANTIGSKSAHIDTSQGSVELKVLIEQMREQIQNIE